MRELQLSARSDKSKSPKGRETQYQILLTARDIFIDHGYGEFSIQKVADQCGLSRGNVCYYYPTRSSLLHELLQAVVQGYVDDFEEVAVDKNLNPEEKFLSIIEMIMMDLATKETSGFFPELWALSNHNEDALVEMNLIYEKARRHITDMLKYINPSLTGKERKLVGLFISASMEGHTPFVGHGKEWEKSLPRLTNIAAFSFLNLAKSITSKDIASLAMATKKKVRAAE